MIQPDTNQDPRRETKDDLMGDDLKQYEADIKAMNLILISIPNDIYNYVDSCQMAREMWLRVKCLMQGTTLSVVERDARFNKEFDKFTAETRESVTPLKMGRSDSNVRGRYFIIQHHKIQENDL
ncbi:hypothetical protein Tco_1174287 [Tanacetum coccineum]